MAEPLAYLNGQLVPQAQAYVPVHDAGVVLGATVSELLRTYRGRLFRLEQHVERLFESARLAYIEVAAERQTFIEQSEQLVAHNRRFLPPNGELGLSMFVTAGPVRTYFGMLPDLAPRVPTICIHTFPLQLHLFASAMTDGVRLVTSAIRQIPPDTLDPRMKCRSRMHYYVAEHQVRRIDPDATPLLLDHDGNVTESTTANFLMVKDGNIVSPPREHILGGISREVTLQFAEKLGIAQTERSIPATELVRIDEAFLTSTPYALAHVSHIDGKMVNAGKAGPVFEAILRCWNDVVGLDIRQQILDAPIQ
jgi:branched-subunit amino acid aminotransferase/4-amino-4-deoxychorismate lyase